MAWDDGRQCVSVGEDTTRGNSICLEGIICAHVDDGLFVEFLGEGLRHICNRVGEGAFVGKGLSM